MFDVGAGGQFLAKSERDRIVAHIGELFQMRGAIWIEDVEDNVGETFGEFEFSVQGPK